MIYRLLCLIAIAINASAFVPTRTHWSHLKEITLRMKVRALIIRFEMLYVRLIDAWQIFHDLFSMYV